MAGEETGKMCVVCATLFPSNLELCPQDGSQLVVADADARPGADEPDPERLIGTVMGSYRVVRLIGRGGAGTVYEAEHIRLGRTVAIKVLRPEMASQTEMVARFFNEARIVNEIRHPHIIDVEDYVSSPDGTVHMVMEHLVGRDLYDTIAAEGRLAPDRVIHIGAQIADALAAVHAQGIVHRDLKPDNVFLIDRDGDPDFCKILDFGIAKLNRNDQHLTQSGIAVGTPEYMAPEQILGRAVDGRTDIYSLGIILYEALTGSPPFTDEAYLNVIRSQCIEPPVPPSKRIEQRLPAALEATILRCLNKQIDQRFATMEEVRDALLSGTGAGPGAGRPRRRVRQLVPALAMAAAALALAYVPSLRKGPVASPVPSPPAAVAALPAASPAPPADPAPAASPTIDVVMVSRPDKAELFSGPERKPLGRAPLTIHVPVGTRPLVLVARFADGSEATETVVPDRPPPPVVFVQPAPAAPAKVQAPPAAEEPPAPAPKSSSARPKKKSGTGGVSREGSIDPFR